MTALDIKETLCGTVLSVRYHNEDNGYSVLDLQCQEGGQGQGSLLEPLRCTAVGSLAQVSAGEQLCLQGQWVEHAEYGVQFKFERVEAVLPQSEEGIERYLASGLISGIGPVTAKNIVRAFGTDALRVLEHEPGLLAKVKGIGKHRAQQMSESFAEQGESRQAVLALQAYGIGAKEAVRLYQAEGADVLRIIKDNPYRLIDLVPGVGFVRADKIARQSGMEPQSPKRVWAAALYIMRQAQNESGHTCFPLLRLYKRLLELLPECSEDLLRDQLAELLLRKELLWQQHDDIDMAFLPRMYASESGAALRLLELMCPPASAPPRDLRAELEALELASALHLDPQQRQAVLGAFSSGVYVITGGPGTGKTTILTFILQLMDKLGQSVALAAPTGRAAKRLSEATDSEAYTLHRLLGYNGDHFLRNAKDPLEYDVLIVDEMSMVDVPLLAALLRAVLPGTRLVLVGDADQLPSVGAGNVLADLIDSHVLPVTRLTQVFRQGKRSRIITNAHCINGGEMPLLDYTDDFAFQQLGERQRVLERILRICAEGKLGDPFEQIQVLSPMKNGTLGVIHLNQRLQEALNPPHRSKQQLARGERIFREGDKVMQTKNNYKTEWVRPGARGMERGTGVYNGDVGRIVAIDSMNKELEVMFDDAREAVYTLAMLDELELAYAMTIHKSQGSEFPIVLMPLCDGPPMLMTRNLLYTAVTRARDRVVIIGWQASIERMVGNVQERERFSALDRELRRLAPTILKTRP